MTALGTVLVLGLLFALGAFEQAASGFADLTLRLEHFGAAALVLIVTFAYVAVTWERRRSR